MRLIGMVHVPPLPGSPRWAGSMERVVTAALADARALVDNGMDAMPRSRRGGSSRPRWPPSP
jgi:predicted TIM-barrel enzyme